MAKAKKRIPAPDRIAIVGTGGGDALGFVDAQESVIRTRMTLSGESRDRVILITRAAAQNLYYELATILFANAVVFRPRRPKGGAHG